MLVPALLRRFGRVRLEDDITGCTLGVRELDPHIDVLLAFGAEVDLESLPANTGSTTPRSPRPKTSCCARPSRTAARG
jgi:UDP-N-acetylglucosamine enolpyruvyl transferase